MHWWLVYNQSLGIKDNDSEATLVPDTIEINEILLLKLQQHGHHDVVQTTYR